MAADPGKQRQSQIASFGNSLLKLQQQREWSRCPVCVWYVATHSHLPPWNYSSYQKSIHFQGTLGNINKHYTNCSVAPPTLHTCGGVKKTFVINFILTEAAKSQLEVLSTPWAEWWIWSKIQPGLIEGLLGSRSQHLFPNIPIPYPCSHLYSTKFSSEVGGGHSPCRFSHNLNSSVHSPSFVQRMGS